MSTDPTSAEFDPIRALYSSQANEQPTTSVKIYDNVATFEAKLKKNQLNQDEEVVKKSSRKSKSFSQNKKLKAEAEKRDLSKLKEMMEKRKKMDRQQLGEDEVEEEVAPKRKEKQKKNVLNSMANLSEGPMKLLHEVFSKRKRCDVYTRNFCGIRGVLSGYIVAFDRYMNLIMVDVDETFCNPPLGKVKEHQKKLTVSQLQQSIANLKLEDRKRDSKPRRPRKTTGVTFVDKKETPKVVGDTPSIKRLRNHKKRLETFSGGSAQLYQRHLKQVYVRGDSIVLISSPD